MGMLKIRTNGSRVGGGASNGGIKRAVKAPVGSRCTRQMVSAFETWLAVSASSLLDRVPDLQVFFAEPGGHRMLSSTLDFALSCAFKHPSAGADLSPTADLLF